MWKKFLFILIAGTASASSHGSLEAENPLLKIIQDIKSAKDLADYGDKIHKWKHQLNELSSVSEKDCEQISSLPYSSIGSLYPFTVDKDNKYLPGKCGDTIRFKALIAMSSFTAKEEQLKSNGQKSKRKKIKPVFPDAPLVNELEIDYRKGPVYFTADLPKGFLALTFDDGPHSTLTEEVLDILKAEGIRVTFFGVGKNAVKFPEIVRRAIDEGHSFGSHSNDHSNLPKLSRKAAQNNILTGHESIMDITQRNDAFFRFPYGNRTKRLQKFVSERELATFFWNIDTLDWKLRDPAELYDYSVDLINKYQRGIVLFHDIQPQTRAVLSPLLQNLKTAGYVFVVFVR